MLIFDVTDCRCEIIKPNTTLSTWSKTNNPYAVCNASLYDFKTREPVGTIIENGKIVHSAGNGYGVGTINGKPGFGNPWVGWSDYLTGYNSPVQNGKYVAPPFDDGYVFNYKLERIAIGRKNGRIYIVTADNVTLKQFAEDAIRSGFDTLVNLDGGGSRHLVYNGRTIYSSPRVPYNAIAFFNSATSAKPEPNKCPYPEPTRNLLLLSRGEDVKWLQWHLNERGFRSGVIDGIFGWNTWNALFSYQKTWSRVPDGICGPNTRGNLKNDL